MSAAGGRRLAVAGCAVAATAVAGLLSLAIALTRDDPGTPGTLRVVVERSAITTPVPAHAPAQPAAASPEARVTAATPRSTGTGVAAVEAVRRIARPDVAPETPLVVEPAPAVARPRPAVADPVTPGVAHPVALVAAPVGTPLTPPPAVGTVAADPPSSLDPAPPVVVVPAAPTIREKTTTHTETETH